jgi:hypothetical protein
MKNLLILSLIVGLAFCTAAPKPKRGEAPDPAAPDQAPAQTEAAAPALSGDTFIGTIAGYRMGGTMGKPYVRAQIMGEDGQKVEFNLRKTTVVTDPEGNPIGFTKRFKNGRRVEITFVVRDGKNEAVAWHYLD